MVERIDREKREDNFFAGHARQKNCSKYINTRKVRSAGNCMHDTFCDEYTRVTIILGGDFRWQCSVNSYLTPRSLFNFNADKSIYFYKISMLIDQ